MELGGEFVSSGAEKPPSRWFIFYIYPSVSSSSHFTHIAKEGKPGSGQHSHIFRSVFLFHNRQTTRLFPSSQPNVFSHLYLSLHQAAIYKENVSVAPTDAHLQTDSRVASAAKHLAAWKPRNSFRSWWKPINKAKRKGRLQFTVWQETWLRIKINIALELFVA